MKKAFILGINGQDGSYLAELLLEKGYEVHGLVRRNSIYPVSLTNIKHILPKLQLHFGDLQNVHPLSTLIRDLQPNEIYNLASQSDVRVSFDIPEYTGDITGLGVTRLLETILHFSPSSRLYQASSSEMFGSSPPPQSETTPFRPQSPYAAAKLYAHNICQIYRESYNLFICCGILFNHESKRRGENFVTRKITKAAVEIKRGQRKELYLGNLTAKRDWGYAPDYVRAMWMMMQRERPSDFVIGTGEAHTVQEFVEEVFNLLELDWRKYVKIDPHLFRPNELNYLKADASKAKRELGWEPNITFKELVKRMVEAER